MFERKTNRDFASRSQHSLTQVQSAQHNIPIQRLMVDYKLEECHLPNSLTTQNIASQNLNYVNMCCTIHDRLVCFVFVLFLVCFVFVAVPFFPLLFQRRPHRRRRQLIDDSFYSISGLSKNEHYYVLLFNFHAHNPMNKQQQQTNLIWRRSIPFRVALLKSNKLMDDEWLSK